MFYRQKDRNRKILILHLFKKKAQLLLNFFEFSLNIYRFSINVIELITIKYYRTIKNLIKIHSLLILWIIDSNSVIRVS